jgi:hypothetical protein
MIGHDASPNDNTFGRMVLRFDTSPPSVQQDFSVESMNMFLSNASMSDSLGNLLFYTNGCDIADPAGNILPNGDELSPGVHHDILCHQYKRGYFAGYPSMVILPLPEQDSLYYLFYGSVFSTQVPTPQAYVDRLLYSVVKVAETGVSVVAKNLPLVVDTMATGELSVVKHANGKDWWIVWPQRNSNRFYVFLFTKEGIVDTSVQTIGPMPPADKEGYGQTTFSPDGSRLIRFFPYTDVMDFSFDRATGQFTNYKAIPVNYGNDFITDGGCAISPSGRYLYIMATVQVYQFDLWAQDVAATQIKVGIWDGFVAPFAVGFYVSQLGPDCKIYIIGGGDTRYYHVIHNPDEAGLACNLEQRGMVFPMTTNCSIPYFPNYRLGPIDNPGVPCSPVVATTAPMPGVGSDRIRVWPNPASTQLTLEGLEGARVLRFYNNFGQLQHTSSLSGIANQNTTNVSDWASGLYFYQVSFAGGQVVTGKIMVGDR